MNKTSALASTIANKYDLSQSDAERFVASMFEVINDTLQSGDKQVKVKGLGSFKVTSVNSRESVDVNTGERITIEGRNKISFIPDASLKDRVNMPFAQFETVVVNDGVDFNDVEGDDLESPEETVEHSDIINTNAAIAPCLDTEQTQPNEDDASLEHKDGLFDEPKEALSATEKALIAPQNVPSCEPHETEVVMDVAETKSAMAHVEKKDDSNQVVQEKEMDSSKVPTDNSNNDIVTRQQENDNGKSTRIETIEENIMHKLHSMNKTITALVATIIVLLIFGSYCVYHYKKMLTMSNNRILELEITLDNIQAEMHHGDTAALKVNPKPKSQNAKVAKPETQTAKAVPPKPKKQEAKQQAQVAPEAKPFSGKYDSDPRIRTGAYVITGIDKTVTVRKGQTLQSISKTQLGPGMECYVEAVNEKREYMEGEKVKIPSLKLKRAVTKRVAQ